MWYDVNKTLTHNALINIIIGPRGFGKTYALKKKAISNFITKGQQFIYLRRYQAELDLVKETLFNDIVHNGEFPGEIEFHQDVYKYDGKAAGYCMALSRANHYKSASFPLVSLIIFDEFIIDPSQNARYLKNEVRKLLDAIETIGRMRDNIKVFLLANSLSFVNPYTLYWNLKQPKNSNVTKAVNNLVLLELVGDDEFRDAKEQTLFGQLIHATQYSEMSVNNKFILDSDTFLATKPGTSRYTFTLETNGLQIGVWYDAKDAMFYLDEDIDPSCLIVLTVDIDDHNDNSVLVSRANTGVFATLVRAFKYGQVRFSNIKVKSYMLDIFKYLV